MSISSEKLKLLKALMAQEPYASMASDDDRLAAMNAKSVTTHARIPLGEAERVLKESGDWWQIKAVQDTNQYAEMAMDMLTARFDELTVFSPAVQSAFAGLVAADLMSQASRDAIEKQAAVMVTPAQDAGIAPYIRMGWFDMARAI